MSADSNVVRVPRNGGTGQIAIFKEDPQKMLLSSSLPSHLLGFTPQIYPKVFIPFRPINKQQWAFPSIQSPQPNGPNPTTRTFADAGHPNSKWTNQQVGAPRIDGGNAAIGAKATFCCPRLPPTIHTAAAIFHIPSKGLGQSIISRDGLFLLIHQFQGISSIG